MMNKMALVRIVVFLLAWGNQILVQKGFEPLPVVSEESIASVLTLLASIWTLATNNTVKKKDKPL